MTAAIPQRELRNNVSAVLRRVEHGEELTVTVAGRPMAHLRPIRPSAWLSGRRLESVWAGPSPTGLIADCAEFDIGLTDPFAR